MTAPPLPEQIELRRDRMWRRDEELRVESAVSEGQGQACDFAILTQQPISSVELPKNRKSQA